MKKLVLACIVPLLLLAPAFAADSLEVKGKLDAVTVYRGQALITRLVDIPGPAGLREIIVSELPERVLASSLAAESADGVEVRSVLYRERPVTQDVRTEVRQLDDKIRALADQIATNQRSQQVLQDQSTYLSKLEQFTAPTATVELSKGVLNAETLKSLTDYVFKTRQSIADQGLKLTLQARDLKEQLDTLQRQRQQMADRSARSVREAVVFVNLKTAPGKLRLRYLVDAATWDPSYNVRADGKGTVAVEYNAAIQQQSGEDWTDVSMTLSTATPSLIADAPSLSPLTIALIAGQPTTAALDISDIRSNFAQQKAQAEVMRNSGNNLTLNNGFITANAPGGGGRGGGGFAQQAGGPAPTNFNLDLNLNEIAAQQQVAELLARDSRKAETGAPRQPREVISVTYDLPSRTSLPSRSDRQLIQIAAMPLTGQFYKVAIPVLTSYVYDQATLTNNSKMVLLAGPVASYMAGQFVGSSEIPTVAVGENFTVGFGIDSGLRASRERAEKSETVQGGNRLLAYTYRLAVDNFSANPVEIRLMDRLPNPRDTVRDSEVRVTLDPTTAELSKDAEYLRTERKKGLLRWDVKVPAQAISDNAFTIEYKFKIEYDRQMAITGLPVAEASKK